MDQDTQDDDLMAGFENDPTETPERIEPPQDETTQDETPAEPAPAAPAPPVKFAQIPEDEYLSLKATAAKIPEIEARSQQQLDKAFGKIGELGRLVQESRTSSGGLTKEDVDQFRGDFPELAGVLDKMVGPKQINTDEVVKPALAELERKFEVRLVTRAHRDWQEVSRSEDFKAWTAAKPQDYQQQLATSWDADFLIDALTEFKESRKAPAAPAPAKVSTRKDVLASAIQPRGSVGHQTGANDEDEFMSGFQTG